LLLALQLFKIETGHAAPKQISIIISKILIKNSIIKKLREECSDPCQMQSKKEFIKISPAYRNIKSPYKTLQKNY
jgi:hypothetical protein